jgi:hypothetical protein
MKNCWKHAGQVTVTKRDGILVNISLAPLLRKILDSIRVFRHDTLSAQVSRIPVNFI